MGILDYLEHRIHDLEKAREDTLRELDNIKERFARADAKRIAEGGMEFDRKWSNVYDLLESDLSKARARLTSIDVELSVKRQKMAEHLEKGKAGEADIEMDVAEEIEFAEETVPSSPPVERSETAIRLLQETVQRTLQKTGAGRIGAVTLAEVEAIVDFLAQLRSTGEADHRTKLLRKTLMDNLGKIEDEFIRLRNRWTSMR